MPDKTQNSAAWFLTETVIAQCLYQIDFAYSDDGKVYKATDSHASVRYCKLYGNGQKFTQVNRPQTNGKAERVIRTLIQMWHNKNDFKDGADRQIQLNFNCFINIYKTVKPSKGLNNSTPYEVLFQNCNQPLL